MFCNINFIRRLLSADENFLTVWLRSKSNLTHTYGIGLLFAQSFPKRISTSTVEAGFGLIQIRALSVTPNKDWKYFNV